MFNMTYNLGQIAIRLDNTINITIILTRFRQPLRITMLIPLDFTRA